MKKKEEILIRKASGQIVPFSEEKLRTSLQRAGANKTIIENILENLQPKLYKGISTKKIYRIAFQLLKESSKHLAAKYHLKRAIMELGPSGYPFESFIAEILKREGYAVKVGETVNGKCVNHEIDIIAQKDHHHLMIECKYHNQPGTISDVKIPLYIQARFKDVEQQWIKIPGHKNMFHQAWVVTNTKFTSDAIKYGTCAGLHMMSWDYPIKNGLKDQIDTLGLYPVTCLVSLTKVEKQRLLDSRIVLCKTICNNPNLLLTHGISAKRLEVVLKEAQTLCEGGTEKNEK